MAVIKRECHLAKPVIATAAKDGVDFKTGLPRALARCHSCGRGPFVAIKYTANYWDFRTAHNRPVESEAK